MKMLKPGDVCQTEHSIGRFNNKLVIVDEITDWPHENEYRCIVDNSLKRLFYYDDELTKIGKL